MATKEELTTIKNHYADDFINTILFDLNETDKELPGVNISYYLDAAIDDTGNELPDMRGLFSPDENEIMIFDCRNESIEGIKIALRHELLHFILCSLGRPYKDTDEEFMKLAFKYHACSYGMLKKLGISFDDLLKQYIAEQSPPGKCSHAARGNGETPRQDEGPSFRPEVITG